MVGHLIATDYYQTKLIKTAYKHFSRKSGRRRPFGMIGHENIILKPIVNV